MKRRDERIGNSLLPPQVSVRHFYGGLPFSLKPLNVMSDIKNRIETALVDGVCVSFDRSGDSCMVNLSEMAKPFGKRPKHWLRLEETKEYLEALKNVKLSQVADMQLGDFIITRHGGTPGLNGTWCTDYRIAMRFAQWLSPKFSIMVDDLLVRIANGERLIDDSDLLSLDGSQWVTCETYCAAFDKSMQSFYGLLGNYPKEFAYLRGQWFMSRNLFALKETQARFERQRTALANPSPALIEARQSQ